MITYGKIALVDNVGAEMLDEIERKNLADVGTGIETAISCRETIAGYIEEDVLGKYLREQVLAEMPNDTDFIHFSK